jgi:hypothetical protein
MRLNVPYQAVKELRNGELRIDQPGRCSHCNAEPAPMVETHAVTIKTEHIPHRRLGARYRSQTRILVRLPLCEACYLKEYLVVPDSYTKDNTDLGAQSRARDRLANIAGVCAALGILLMTPLLPGVGILGVLKSFWYILLVLGIALLIVAWVMQRSSQSNARRKLEALHVESRQYPRADVWSEVVEDPTDLSATAVRMILENERWMQDCASLKGWRVEE